MPDIMSATSPIGDATSLSAPKPGAGGGARDKNFLVLPRQKICYAVIPKAANSSVRYLLARRFKFGQLADARFRPSQNKYWTRLPETHALMLDAKEFIQYRREIPTFCFTVVREPISRLYSAWNNKIIENAESSFSARFVKMGVKDGMPFDEFVDCVAASGDRACDVHVRSQTSVLCQGGQVIPDFVARLEKLESDWEMIQYQIKMRTGYWVPDIIEKNVRANVRPSIASELSRDTIDKIIERYRADYRRFYPHALKELQAGTAK